MQDKQTLSLLEPKNDVYFHKEKRFTPSCDDQCMEERGPGVKCCMVTWRAGEGRIIEHSFGNIDIILYYPDSKSQIVYHLCCHDSDSGVQTG